jgi:uncharacterized DUF497 family protein
VPPVVYDLKVRDFARVKLGRRNISAEEARQLRWNKYEMRADPHAPAGTDRYYLFGVTNGGRRLTLVIEPTTDPTTWEVVTGWQPAERRLR